eukprot:GILK01002242.1.p1 GENE.GILK01002242.1~~GILK01002242.1.p1  ORF type:complete len:426 (-),score=59.79 GILK01002242.1:186-1463(-)
MSRRAWSRVAVCAFVLCLAFAAEAFTGEELFSSEAFLKPERDECHQTSKDIFLELTGKEAPLAKESLKTSPLMPSDLRARFIHGGNNLIARFAIQGEAFNSYHCAHEFTILKGDTNSMFLVQSYANLYTAPKYRDQELKLSKAKNMFVLGSEDERELQALGTFQRLLRCLASTKKNPCLSDPLFYVPDELHGHIGEFCDYFCKKANSACFKCRAYAALFIRKYEKQDGLMKKSSMMFGNLVAQDENVVGFEVYDATNGEVAETPQEVKSEVGKVESKEEFQILSRRKSTRSLYPLDSWKLDKIKCRLAFTRLKNKDRKRTKYICVRHLDTTMINGDKKLVSSLIWHESKESKESKLYMPHPSGFAVYGEVTTENGECSETEDPSKGYTAETYYRFEVDANAEKDSKEKSIKELQQLYSQLAVCSG